MPIRRKSSLYKKLYEINGQRVMFGNDNIQFKTVNLPKPQKFRNLCHLFGLKKIVQQKKIYVSILQLKKLSN